MNIRRVKPRDHLPACYVLPPQPGQPFHKALWSEIKRDGGMLRWAVALAVLAVVVVLLTPMQ